MKVYEVDLPETNQPFTIDTDLSGELYKLTFRPNKRAKKWYLTIHNASNKLIVAGLPLLPKQLITTIHKNSLKDLPKGDLVIETKSTDDLFDLTNLRLFYAD